MKLKHLIPVLLLALCLLAAPAAAAGGAGTASNPYVIQTPAELQSIANDLSAYYVLGNDIDMSGYSFVSIGTSSAPFFGSLDGRGYTLSNLNLQTGGMFSLIAGATLKNINIVNSSADGSQITAYNAILVSTITGVDGSTNLIDNVNLISCYVKNPDVGRSGLLIGRIASNGQVTINDCHIKDSYFHTTNNPYYTGGIVGSCAGKGDVIITGCSVADSVLQMRSHGGGICGTNMEGGSLNISDCVVNNSILIGSENYIGGIMGSLSIHSSTTYIQNCIVESCTILANRYCAGGIVGAKYTSGYGDISDCSVSNTTVQASQYAGGICSNLTW